MKDIIQVILVLQIVLYIVVSVVMLPLFAFGVIPPSEEIVMRLLSLAPLSFVLFAIGVNID